MYAGNYFIGGGGGNVNLATGGSGMTYLMVLEGPVTTGMALAKQSQIGTPTTFSKNGTWNFNATNLTGTISLVQPNIAHGFVFTLGVLTGTRFNQANIGTTVITFLPEPAEIALLGAGLLGIAALYRRRR